MTKILDTERLILREFEEQDASFIIQLLNSPGWIEFIGDRNIKTHTDALGYLREGPMKSYAVNGFGLYLVELKNSGASIGMCGLIRRDTLPDVDLGFAFLPQFMHKGYAFEAASHTLRFAKEILKLERILAITVIGNIGSINLLQKIGLTFDKFIQLPHTEEQLLLFSDHIVSDDKKEIDIIMGQFFSIFNNVNKRLPNMQWLYKLCIKEAIIIKNLNAEPVIYSLKSFIDPREKLLTDGSLVDFSEKELTEETKIAGNIAQRFSTYEKSGTLNGVYFKTEGMKTTQFIRTKGGWKISALAWDDKIIEK